MELKDRISSAMKAAGMSQADLCRATEMGSSKISQLLKGKVEDPRLSTAIKIADALDVSLDYLAGRERPHDPPSHGDPRRQRLVDAYEQMSEDGRQNALATVTALLGAERARDSEQVQGGMRKAV